MQRSRPRTPPQLPRPTRHAAKAAAEQAKTDADAAAGQRQQADRRCHRPQVCAGRRGRAVQGTVTTRCPSRSVRLPRPPPKQLQRPPTLPLLPPHRLRLPPTARRIAHRSPPTPPPRPLLPVKSSRPNPPRPRSRRPASAPAGSSAASAAVAAALSKVGSAYVYGAAGPNSFDCSGLTSWAWAPGRRQHPADVGWPGRSAVGPAERTAARRPGDLLLAGQPRRDVHRQRPDRPRLDRVTPGLRHQRQRWRPERQRSPRRAEPTYDPQSQLGSAQAEQIAGASDPFGSVTHRRSGLSGRHHLQKGRKPSRAAYVAGHQRLSAAGGWDPVLRPVSGRAAARRRIGCVCAVMGRRRGIRCAQPFPVYRHPGSLMLPDHSVRRRAAELVREHAIRAVWYGAAAPLSLLTPALRVEGVTRTVASTHGHEVGWSMVPGARQRAAPDRPHQ